MGKWEINGAFVWKFELYVWWFLPGNDFKLKTTFVFEIKITISIV